MELIPSTELIDASRTNWWFWFAWTISPEHEPIHIFGCCAPSTQPARYQLSSSIALPSSAKLEIRQIVISDQDAEPMFQGLEGGRFDLAALVPDAPGQDVYPAQDIIAPVFGNDAGRVRSFIGTSEVLSLFSNHADIPAVLDVLRDHLGFDFRDAYLNHLGGFDILQVREDLDEADRFVCTALKAHGGEAHPSVMVARRDDLSANLMVHIVATNADNAVVLNKLVPLPAGTPEIRVPASQNIFGIEVSIFDGDGEVLYAMEQAYIRTVQTTLHAATGSVKIEDKLRA